VAPTDVFADVVTMVPAIKTHRVNVWIYKESVF